MSSSARSVMNTWKRWPSASVKVSWAPGWGSSRRAMARVPWGQRWRSTRSVISATSAPSRSSLPSAVMAGRQRRPGTAKQALRIGSVRSWPMAKRTLAARQVFTNPWVSAAESARALTSTSAGSTGNWSRVKPSNSTCSAVALDAALPGRRIPAGPPRGGGGRGPRLGDRPQRVGVDDLQGPPRRGRRGDLTEQRRLVTQHREIRDGFAAGGDHRRHIDQHLAPVMAPAPLLGRCHRHRQRLGQPQFVGQIRQQAGARMAHHVLAVRAHLQPGTTRVTLHLGSALLLGTTTASTTAVSLARRAFSWTRTLTPTQLPKGPG